MLEYIKSIKEVAILAREGLLVGQGDEKINSDQITLKTKKDKFNNWWHYSKFTVIILAVVILLVIITVYQILTQVKPDYEVGVVTSYNLSDQLSSVLTDTLEQYGSDLNGDGKVVVQVTCYVLSTDSSSSDDAQYNIAQQTKLTADLTTKENMIYIYDDSLFKTYLGDDYNSMFASDDSGTFSYKVSDFAFYNTLDTSSIENSGIEISSFTDIIKDMRISLLSSDYIDDKTKLDNASVLFERLKG
jgi:hypothetical protein